MFTYVQHWGGEYEENGFEQRTEWRLGLNKTYLPAPKSQPIRIHSGTLTSTPSNIVVALSGKCFFCLIFELVWVRGYRLVHIV